MCLLTSSSDEVLEAILASIRADLHAVSFLDMSSANTAATWVKEHVPGACSVEPYDLVVCQAEQFARAMEVCAPTSLLLVERAISTPLDTSSVPSHGELSKISRVRAGDVHAARAGPGPRSGPPRARGASGLPTRRAIVAAAAATPSWSWSLGQRSCYYTERVAERVTHDIFSPPLFIVNSVHRNSR